MVEISRTIFLRCNGAREYSKNVSTATFLRLRYLLLAMMSRHLLWHHALCHFGQTFWNGLLYAYAGRVFAVMCEWTMDLHVKGYILSKLNDDAYFLTSRSDSGSDPDCGIHCRGYNFACRGLSASFQDTRWVVSTSTVLHAVKYKTVWPPPPPPPPLPSSSLYIALYCPL